MADAREAVSAQVSVLRQYASAFDHWSEQEQLAALHQRHIEAEGCHQMALYVLRAYRAECDDPEPRKEP